jgi:hypothetical protein
MRRAGSRAEQIEIERRREKTPVVIRNCCPEFSPWRWFRGFFWDERLMLERRIERAPLRMWGGVTILGILLTLSFIWWASETVAWYVLSLPIFVLLSLD